MWAWELILSAPLALLWATREHRDVVIAQSPDPFCGEMNPVDQLPDLVVEAPPSILLEGQPETLKADEESRSEMGTGLRFSN